MENNQFIPYADVEMDSIIISETTGNSLAVSVRNVCKRSKNTQKKCYVFLYVITGILRTSLPGEKNRAFTLRSGDGMLFRPVDEVGADVTENCQYRLIGVWENLMRETCRFLSPDAFSLIGESAAPLPFSLLIENMYCLENCLEQFINCGYPNVQIQHSKAIATLLVNQTINSHSDGYADQPAIIKQLLSILNYLPNIKNGIPPKIYEMGYSKSYICKIFKKHMGMSITNYITYQKIRHSIHIFNERNASLAEVCEELGFESVPYFNKTFKKMYGITPAKYRSTISR